MTTHLVPAWRAPRDVAPFRVIHSLTRGAGPSRPGESRTGCFLGKPKTMPVPLSALAISARWAVLFVLALVFMLGSGSLQAAEPEPPALDKAATTRTIQTVALFAAVSFAPVAILMVTAFVRINIVLTLLRQAMGSPQVPGTQVITALALLLTILVMRPRGEAVYHDAIAPYAEGRLTAREAWDHGVTPIKAFMIETITQARRQYYLSTLLEQSRGPTAHPEPPADPMDYPLTVVAPAFLLCELTTALKMGFFLYLPFLVIDLVTASVLGATGLYMLPPSLVSTPAKLIVFVLADGWMLVASMLVSSFGVG